LAVPAVVVAYLQGVRFSNRAYVQGTVFLLLHTAGSHYTYSEVPIGEWFRAMLGGRNHYDRLVHFAFGLLLLRACAEAAFRRGPGRFSARELALSCGVIGWWSAAYEIAEWLVAIIVDPQAEPRSSACRATHGMHRKT
jgi:putative membrane protein